MMSEKEKETWAERAVRERRARAAVNPSALANTNPMQTVPAGDVPVAKDKQLSDEQRGEIRREIEALKDRPVLRARRLAQYVAEGLSQGDIALALGVQQPWVSKRIALSRAPVEVLQQIEAGAITEHQYYSNRAEIEMRLAGASQRPPHQRPIPLTITLDTGRALAELLALLAEQRKLTPIRLDANAGKTEVAAVLNLRARELLEAHKNR